MKTYLLEVGVSIDSYTAWQDIPGAELIYALEKRLESLKKVDPLNVHEAFSFVESLNKDHSEDAVPDFGVGDLVLWTNPDEDDRTARAKVTLVSVSVDYDPENREHDDIHYYIQYENGGHGVAYARDLKRIDP